MNSLEEAYDERIAHLRTGLKMAESDINLYKQMLGLEPTKVIQILLDNDIDRSVAMDKLR